MTYLHCILLVRGKEALPDGTVFYKPLADSVFKAMFVGRRNLLKYYLDMFMEEEVNVINSNILELHYKSVWSKKTKSRCYGYFGRSTSTPILAYGCKIIAYDNETIDWKEYGGFSYEVLNKIPIDLNEELQNIFYSIDNYGSTLADYFYSEDDFEKFISIRDEFSSYDVFPLSLAANDTAERTEEGKYIIRLTVPQISRKYNNYIILEDTPSNGISVSNVNETDIDLEKKTITFESESMSILYIFFKKN